MIKLNILRVSLILV